MVSINNNRAAVHDFSIYKKFQRQADELERINTFLLNSPEFVDNITPQCEIDKWRNKAFDCRIR